MLSSMWNFVKRHRRKFIFLSVALGSAALINAYARRKLREWQQQQAIEFLDKMRREQHFENLQRTCNVTTMTMLKNVQQKVLLLIDTQSIIDELKLKPKNRVELWNELKYLTFAKAVLSVYSTSMLVLLLRAQMNIIGGYMYVDALGEGGANGDCRGAGLQHKYLQLTIKNFIECGLGDLMSMVMAAAKLQLSSVDLKAKLRIADVETLFCDIRNVCEPEVMSNATRFVLPPEDNSAHYIPKEDVTFQQLLNETRDLLESRDFGHVFKGCVDIGFGCVMDNLVEFFIPEEGSGDGGFKSPNELVVAVPKLIPILNGCDRLVYDEKRVDGLVQKLLVSEGVKRFGSNVYDAFGSKVKNDDISNHNIVVKSS